MLAQLQIQRIDRFRYLEPFDERKLSLAEGVGFEPTEHLAMLNGFQVLRRSCYLVRLMLSSGVLSRVSCYLVRLVLSCVIRFCLQRVYKAVLLVTTMLGIVARGKLPVPS